MSIEIPVGVTAPERETVIQLSRFRWGLKRLITEQERAFLRERATATGGLRKRTPTG